jgi:tetratricopeptide (TPR) repeat protein
MLCRNGHFAEAEKHWLRALKISQEAYGGDVQQYTAILTHLGELYAGIGQYESAEDVFKRSLAGYEKAGAPSSVTHAVIMSQLGNVYTRLKRYSEAEPLFSRSIDIVNEDPHSAPLGNALVLSRAGDFYMTRHEWVAAERQYRRALNLRERVLGDHPLVAASLASLSHALRKLSRKQEAKDDLARASQILAVQSEPVYTGETVDVRQYSSR